MVAGWEYASFTWRPVTPNCDECAHWPTDGSQVAGWDYVCFTWRPVTRNSEKCAYSHLAIRRPFFGGAIRRLQLYIQYCHRIRTIVISVKVLPYIFHFWKWHTLRVITEISNCMYRQKISIRLLKFKNKMATKFSSQNLVVWLKNYTYMYLHTRICHGVVLEYIGYAGFLFVTWHCLTWVLIPTNHV